ncbi:site-specific integrase [Hymenobacter elongatus]|uniref:hypothetical protein n=1 Tax=Hymenobacter elongatus TaxID=877208 RepID=UPI001436863C|nr:hypothetical protein [Hymenobacter elongatus]
MRGLNKVTLIGNLDRGLRRNEVPALTPTGIDSQPMALIGVRRQRRKGRNLPLFARLLYLLREQYRQFRPVPFLFEGQQPGEHYSERSLQLVVKQAAARGRHPVSPNAAHATLRICSKRALVYSYHSGLAGP